MFDESDWLLVNLWVIYSLP